MRLAQPPVTLRGEAEGIGVAGKPNSLQETEIHLTSKYKEEKTKDSSKIQI